MTRSCLHRVPVDAHWCLVGGTRRGKSGLLQLAVRAFIQGCVDGVTAIDPHGEFVRAIVDWLANPAHGQFTRTIHLLDPASSASFSLNPLQVEDPSSWDQCHAAANTLASVIESRFGAAAEETPRLARIVYVAAMLCARHGLTLLELLELLSLGGEELRRSLIAEFDNRIVRRELEDLMELAQRQPARFLELVESCKNRLVRWLGDGRLARILGQKKGLCPRTVMDGRHIVLFDGSSLSYSDSAFIGTVLTSMYFTAARHRPPLRAARHRLILDEAESLITADVARMCDQSAKVGLNLVVAIQRLGQLRARGDFIADALLSNCGVRVVFGGLEPESARYMAEMFYQGYLDLCEWKPGSERPVAVGQHKETVHNRSHAVHEAEHESTSITHSRAVGTTRSHMRAITDGASEGFAEASSEAFASGSSSSEAFGTAAASIDGASFSQSLDPNTLNAMFATPTIIGTGIADSSGSSLTDMSSQSFGTSSSRSSGSSSSRSSSTMHAETEAFGEARSEVEGVAVSRGLGKSRGTSRSEGESETFITTYALLPTTIYTLEEQLSRAAGCLANLPRRHCVIKIEDQEPFETRTADLSPPFRSAFFRAQMRPRFLASATARSAFLLPAEEADAAIAARLAGLTRPSYPEPDFTAPEPMPTADPVHDAPGFARDFWARKKKGGPKRRPGRRPHGELTPEHDRFRVIDGDRDDDGDNER